MSKTFLNVGCVIALIFVVLLTSGCRRPKPSEIDRWYEDSVRYIEEAFQRGLRACDTAFAPPSPENSQCRTGWVNWYLEALNGAWNVRQEAIQENWRSTRRSREELEERLRQFLPKWPDIQDIIKQLPRGLTVNAVGIPNDSPVMAPPGIPAPSGGGMPIDPTPITGTKYIFTGTVSCLLENNEGVDELIEGVLVATLVIQLSTDELGTSGIVHSGTIIVSLPGNFEASYTVISDPDNRVTADSTGSGWITAQTRTSYSDQAWEALMWSTARIRLPISIDGAGVMTIDSASRPWSEYDTPRMRPYTDYDLDGVLDFQADFAAFLQAHAAGDLRADINHDDQWDAADIDLWLQHFDEDHAIHGGS